MIPLFIAAIVSLTNEFGMARIDTFGANVLSYVPVGGREVFFRQAEERRTNQWYHGGVPVCWPWFGRYGDPGSALHGFAWSRDWAVDKVENGKRMSKAVLRLERKDEFRLTYEIRLEDELSLCLSMRNFGRDKFVVTTGFHPYFSVSHPKNVTVATAQGPIRCHEAMDGGRPFGAGTYRISDSGLSRGIELKSFGNNKLVIWNIGPDEVQPGLSPTDWQKYICVEPVVSPRCDGFYLQPGRSCDIGMSCRVVNDDCGAVGGIGWIDLNKNGIRDVYEDPSEPVDRRVADLLGRMTLEEKTCQLATLYGSGRVLKDYQPTAEWKNAIWKDGIANIDEELNGVGKCRKERPELVCPFSNHVAAVRNIQRWFVEETRLGIPVDFSNEGIHGLNHTKATPLPAPIGIGSTWNRALVREAGEIVGREAKLIGYSNVYAPILDVARDPRWGRMLECYGEDPYLVWTLGAEMCAGIQSQGVASTLKHYAVYGVPKGGRDGECRTDPHVTPRELHEIFLAPFRRVIQSAHPMGVMCSYNDWNGEPIAASRYFLSDLLRGEYGFDGYVVSDSEAVEYVHTKHAVAETPGDAVRMVLEAGLNVRTHFSPPEDFVRLVREQVGRGCLPMSIVDQRVAEVLSVKFRLGLFDNPYLGDAAKADAEAGMAHHLDFADRIQGESFVLLKNDGFHGV